MWCERCQAEVACQAGSDNQHLQCATCGSDLPTAAASKPTRDPRELLEKWAREDTLDVVMPVISTTVDSGPPADLRKTSGTSREKPQRTAKVPAAGSPSQTYRIPPLTNADAPGQAFSEPLALPVTARVGQGVAYLGVVILSIGAGLVLLDYFGNQAGLAPFGWLATIAGQMLLFLGVVTLISAGLEQASAESARRFDLLSEHLTRVEQSIRRAEPDDSAVVDVLPETVDFGETPAKSSRSRARRSA